MYTLRLLRAFLLFFCIRNFDICESLDGSAEQSPENHQNTINSATKADSDNEKAISATNELSQNQNEQGNSGSGSGSGSASASDDEAEPEDLYFYLFDEESVVTEFEAPQDKEAKDEPDFLYHPQQGHVRIVEFYAHWCPHCAHFRPRYNIFAKKMKEIAERSKIQLDIYAVSCVPHRKLCRAQDINGYPRVKLLIGNETTTINQSDLHPFFILEKVAEKTGTDASSAFVAIEEEEQYIQDEMNEFSSPRTENDSFWIHRSKRDIYNDAYLSFHFAMQHGIFVGRDLPNEEAREAFKNWIDLLNHVLPPSWPLRAMLADINENIETALDSEENLLKIVDRHPPPRKHWSKSCSRGDPTMGYTCGLWQLFHIVTLGVVEWNLNNVAGTKKLFYTPNGVGQVLRHYIDHFFGCEICRTNFLHEYDSCNFQRCERLITGIGSLDDWKELLLWLFEVHNGVNSRLMKERAERDGRVPTQEELIAVEWPSRKDCPKCWRGDGTFDLDVVYSFFQLTYWPDVLFSTEERRKLLVSTGNSKESKTNEDDEEIESWMFSLVGLVLVSFLFTVVSWRAQKQREIERTGKHKKADDDVFV